MVICRDYCAPVIIVVATEEAERISLQNGLLLHELFRYHCVKYHFYYS